MAALGEGDYQAAFSIVYAEQDAETQAAMDWLKWFGTEGQREVSALVKLTTDTTGASAEWFAWLGDEANREVTIAAKMADDAGASLTTWWTNWKAENEAANATWQPTITAVAQWADGIWATLTSEAQTGVGEPLDLNGSWASDTLGGLWSSLQAQFNEPVMIFGSWASTALGGLWDAVQGWFNAKPVTVNVQTSYTPSTQPYGLPTGTQLPVDVTAPYPSYTPGKATGSGFFAGGLALVGEVGPELVSLPRGAQIMRNADTRAVLGSVPRFAEGNTPLGGALKSLLEAMGLWKKVSEPTNMYGVQGAEVMAEEAGKGWKQEA